jgi:hypothetical protein
LALRDEEVSVVVINGNLAEVCQININIYQVFRVSNIAGDSISLHVCDLYSDIWRGCYGKRTEKTVAKPIVCQGRGGEQQTAHDEYRGR